MGRWVGRCFEGMWLAGREGQRGRDRELRIGKMGSGEGKGGKDWAGTAAQRSAAQRRLG